MFYVGPVSGTDEASETLNPEVNQKKVKLKFSNRKSHSGSLQFQLPGHTSFFFTE